MSDPAIVFDGDPVHRGPPDRFVIWWILDHTRTLGPTRYWNDAGTWKKLKTPADFAALNRALDSFRTRAVL